MTDHRIVLASASPRRAELLRLIGFNFEVVPSSVAEDNVSAESPIDHVRRLALSKATDVAQRVPSGLVLGADTIVVLDGKILGKPRDASDAKIMLRELSGRTHQVYTGFSIVEKPGGRSTVDHEVTAVHFRKLKADEIETYVQMGSPLDKAGAYGIQDFSSVFVDRIDGCFYNVVGFPLAKFFTVFRAFTGG